MITAGREVEPLPSADAIYVNAAATFPHHVWLNALNDDGRLLFPLTPTDEIGGMLLVTKVNEAKFSARFLCPARFISMVAAQNPTSSRMLSQAFSRGDIGSVRSLRIGTRPDDSAWCIGEGWWLSVEDESTKGPGSIELVHRRAAPLPRLGRFWNELMTESSMRQARLRRPCNAIRLTSAAAALESP